MKLPIALLFLGLIPLVAGIIRLVGLAASIDSLEGHARFLADPVAGILHIVGTLCFLTLGAFQFAPKLRATRWHRVAGRFIVAGAIVGTLAGMWMAVRWPPKSLDSSALTIVRVVVGSAILVQIAVGLRAAKERDFQAHSRWMTRAYALGAGAGTQVLTYLPLALFTSLQTPTWNVLSMSLGWVINALVAEWSIRRASGPAPLSHATPSMRAALLVRYGGPESVQLGELPRPEPKQGQVRVRLRAASINAMDYRIMRADPFLVRLQFGLFRPRNPRMGADLAGIVDAVGEGVTRVRPGDEVFGEAFLEDGLGSFAESIVVRDNAIVRKPAHLDFSESAALPLASVTALQAVRDRARVRAGQRVLIHGAGGGVGTALVQIAKAYGAHVTAVCGPGSVDLVRELGADDVLDYTRDDFAAQGKTFDAIFGVNGYRPLKLYRDHLHAGGTYVMIGGQGRQLFEALVTGVFVFARSGKNIEILTIQDSLRVNDLEEIRDLVEQRKLRVVIDRVFPLEKITEAMVHAERGHLKGKVVLEML